DLLEPLPFAAFAAAARRVEREPAWFVAADARLGRAGVELAHLVPDADVGCGTRARRLANRRLVDLEHAADALPTVDTREAPERGLAAAARRDEPRDVVVQHVAHERALAAAGHARDADETLERKRDVKPRDVVPLDAFEREPRTLPGSDLAVRHERVPRRRP